MFFRDIKDPKCRESSAEGKEPGVLKPGASIGEPTREKHRSGRKGRSLKSEAGMDMPGSVRSWIKVRNPEQAKRWINDEEPIKHKSHTAMLSSSL